MRAAAALAATLLLIADQAAARQWHGTGPAARAVVAPAPLALSGAVERDGSPSLRPGRITGQLAAGFGGELVGFFVGIPIGAAAGAAIAQVTPMTTRSGAVAGGFVGSIAGLTAGAATGVYLVGSRSDQTASFAATLSGAAVGTAAGLALVRADDTALGRALRPFRPILALPPVGASVGFILTRSYRPAAHP